jgi:hypothetical protein
MFLNSEGGGGINATYEEVVMVTFIQSLLQHCASDLAFAAGVVSFVANVRRHFALHWIIGVGIVYFKLKVFHFTSYAITNTNRTFMCRAGFMRTIRFVIPLNKMPLTRQSL